MNRKQWWPDNRQSLKKGRKAITERNSNGGNKESDCWRREKMHKKAVGFSNSMFAQEVDLRDC